MSHGSKAYESFVRIHAEMGKPPLPNWQSLSHVKRMAWEAAAHAVAMSVLPISLTPGDWETDEEMDDDDIELDIEVHK